MYLRMIRNDLLRNKLISFTTMLFITAATALVSLVSILTINLVGSIDTLTKQTQVPDFLQMHSGDLDQERLENFAAGHENVKAYQVLDFLNIIGSKIQLGDNNLIDNIQDNGFTTQSPYFDYLIDMDGQPIQPAVGELYVPIGYLKDGTAQIGEQAIIAGKEFIIAGFLRDGQMNSPLASSKRFLVNEKDYQELQSEGTLEYLIEFQLKDRSRINQFETAYAAEGLETNGPTLTSSLFKIINGLSDGIMIAIILLVGFLIVIIAFMCIRFTLLTKIEEDYREIGTMKAIGLRLADIKKIYLAKYAAVALAGCLSGLMLSFIFSDPLLANIRLYMGESQYASWSMLLAIFGSIVVFLLVIGYIHFLLRRFRTISAASALRNGSPGEKSSRKKYPFLSKNRLLPINIFLGVKDVLSRKKLYATMLIVLLLSCFIMIVPWNTYQTVSSPSFTKYLGFGELDLMVSMYPSDELTENERQVDDFLNKDATIAQVVQITSKSLKAKKEDGSEEKILVELGDHSAFPIEYNTGKAPAQPNEIALSSLNAAEFGKQVGDTIEIITENGLESFIVSGIYSNIFNGGKTAKATFTAESAPTMWLNYYIKLDNADQIAIKTEEISQALPFVKVTDTHNHKQQVFGTTMASIKTAANIALIVALFITGLVSLLFMKLLVAKDRSAIAILKAIGFTNQDLSKQYAARGIFILVIGVTGGSILANTVGETIAGMAISSFGVDALTFVSHPFIYLNFPILMLFVTLLATNLGTSQAGKIKIAENVKE
ncbi:ABC transporter permease [Gracilibacillus alcaliphilus]|uniref:ABC transporter permease n=1 Tax=Gracilibacillus alcaliphilus TaxID=1401441 RepID=UPI001958DE89|nr:FtsX-like permease family protein [Gracilibacillus alcaliphilus]MBM7675839.1 putative ABC transport system permease protein [Gracilibacillus alcaliphilus]